MHEIPAINANYFRINKADYIYLSDKIIKNLVSARNKTYKVNKKSLYSNTNIVGNYW